MDEISLPGIERWSYFLRRTVANHHAGPGTIDFLLGKILTWGRAGKKVVVELENEAQLAFWQEQLQQIPQGSDKERGWAHFPADLCKQLSALESRLTLARQPRLGAYTAADLLGRQRFFQNQLRAALPGFSINTEGLEFSESEYFTLLDQIQNTRKLARKVGRVDPALRELNSGIFRHQTEVESEAFIRARINEFQQQSATLYRAYSLSLDRFSRQQLEAADFTFRQLLSSTEPLEKELAQLGRIPAAKKEKFRPAWLPLWKAWKKQLDRQDLFEFSLPDRPDKLTVIDLKDLLLKYGKQLEVWYAGQTRRTREASVGLSPGSLATDHPLKAELEQLAERLEKLVAEINEAGVYHLPLSADVATSLRQQKLLEQLQEQLQRTKYLLDNYPPNFRWQQNWFQLLPPARRIVSPLLQFPEEDWANLFSSWYLEKCLQGGLQLITPLIPSANRQELAEQLHAWRFRLLPFKSVSLVVGDSRESHPTTDFRIRFSLLPVEEQEQVRDGKIYASWVPATADTNYHLLAGPVQLPALGFLQTAYSRAFPAWRLRAAWPNAGKYAFSLGRAPVDFSGKWPDPLPDLWSPPEGRLQLFIGRIAANSPGLGQLVQLLQLPHSMEIVHQLSERELTQMLLGDGFQLSFLVAAIIRATECIEDQDLKGWQAMLSESRLRLGIKATKPHPLLETLAVALTPHTYRLNEPWRDTYLPMVVQSASSGQQTVILVDGQLNGAATAAEECLRQADLIAAGFAIYDLPIYRAKEDWEGTVKELLQLAD
ncbi:MAG: hypothetical protein AAF433_12265 [Bacteroidota bacterium]